MTGNNFTPEVGDWFRFEYHDGRTMTGRVTKTVSYATLLRAGETDYIVPNDRLIAKVFEP